MAMTTALEASALLWVPQGRRVRWSHLSCLLPALLCNSWQGFSQVQGIPQGFLICFTVTDTLSFTEQRAEQQCHALPQPL